jgi:hypothetical protein
MRRPEFISRLGSTVVALPATVRWTMRGYRREVRCIARKADSLASGRQLTSTLFGWMTLGIGSSSGFACAGSLGNVRSCLYCGVSRRRAACQCFAMRS